MAANNQIVKKSIQIDAGDTLRTVRSLKQEIADLRDELLNLEQGTEEYDEVQKQLHDDVEDLNEVMGAHKDKAEALEGSYNALQAELKELKQAWKETNDEAERDVLGQKINEVNNQLKEMDASIGDFHRNVGNYESAWNGLTGVMENGEKITDDLEKGIKAFGSALGMTDKQVNSLSKALKSMKDGFKIAKDIAKAREETTKLGTAEAQAAAQGTALATSQKATGAAAKTMAVSEGTAAVATKGLSVAMKGLKTALISTGIGALIVALGTLIGLLDKAMSKAKQARFEQRYSNYFKSLDGALKASERGLEVLDETEKIIDRNVKLGEARNLNERRLLKYQEDYYTNLKKRADDSVEATQKQIEQYERIMDGMKKSERESEEVQNKYKQLQDNLAAFTAKAKEYGETIYDIQTDILVYDEKQKYATKEVTNELTKWSDLVKDPKFQEAWKGLFEMDFGGNSPIETLQAQMEAATALVTKFKGDTSEVERFFQQMISEAEAEWKSLVDKEKEIFDERLTPAQRLENEKAEWVELANKWGIDSINIIKYYDKKINEELKKAADEREAQREAELQKVKDQTREQLDMMEDALSTQEKMHDIFNPMYMTDTASGDIEQEMNNLKTLYDTQMGYLNGLLESADLTEEAYQGVEDRIVSLTVAFNSQMDNLKKEADYQGKNWAILSRKGVANFNLLEGAAADFSSTFQSLGLENSVAYKGFATAQAIISSILAANRVLAEEPGGAIIKGIAAAATLAAGLANVAAIWMVNPDGSNAGSAMNTSMEQPAVPVIGNAQPINYTRNITTAAEEDEMNQPIYVTVTDIEDGINGRRAQVENSSF